MRVVVVTPPEPADVVSLDDAKLHLHVTHNDEDTLIPTYVAAAFGHIDGPKGWLGRCIGLQTLEARLDGFSCRTIRLPYPEVISVQSVTYLDAAGDEQTTAFQQYGDEIEPGLGLSWPLPQFGRETVRIRYTAGYQIVPEPIRAAILFMVGDMHAFRATAVAGGVAAVPMSATVENLLAPHRIYT